MLDFGADQNFDMNYAEAVWNLNREIHIRHVSEDGISDAVDDQILEWASAHGLVLLTHDRRTIPNFAYQRLGQGLPMPGVIVVQKSQSYGEAARDILKVAVESNFGELESNVVYVPLK